jgi:hypothetical protein
VVFGMDMTRDLAVRRRGMGTRCICCVCGNFICGLVGVFGTYIGGFGLRVSEWVSQYLE